jgi:N-acetyl-1-D-myo-inositol-2-amino-2-deoxy-alpha-D-glucopyranoside deacetylase
VPPGSPLPAAARSVLFVHAHPDDESIGTGATMAKYAAQGARVTLVTCTLGEYGEIVPPGLADLAWDREDRLGAYRITELDAAMRELGVADHRFLGGPGRYHDSGMMGSASNAEPGVFWQADVDEAAALLAEVVREVRPQVLVTYDEFGGYGHPDHIQAHRVAMRAFELTGKRGKFYATAMPRRVLEAASVLPEDSWFIRASDADLSVGVPDDEVTTSIEASRYLEVKIAAMRAHETQITVDGKFYALSNEIGHRVLATEYYTLLAGARGAGDPYESDLFAE